MGSERNAYVCVSEDAIAFWGCMFPCDRQPEKVHRVYYANSPMLISVFGYPEPPVKYSPRTINCWFEGSRLNKEWIKGSNSYDEKKKYRGYHIAWYTHDVESIPEDLSIVHSALIFGRCFFFPTREEFVEVHASRVQHLFGAKNLDKKGMKRLLFTKTPSGYSFCDVVISLKKHGLSQLPVDFLRMWVSGAFDSVKIDAFMRLGDSQAPQRRCCFCIAASGSSFMSVIKAGDVWLEVIIRIDGSGGHASHQDMQDIEKNEGQFVMMGCSHLISYGINDSLIRSPLTYGRCLRWGHRLLRNLILGVDVDDEMSNEYVRKMLLSSLRGHLWSTSEYAPLYRLLWLMVKGVDTLPINKRAVLSSFNAYTAFLTETENFDAADRAQLAIWRSAHNV